MVGRIANAALALVILAVSPAANHANPSLPRTPDGRPDPPGVWDFRTQSPLERPKEMGKRAFLTPQEIADLRVKASAPRSIERDPLPPIADDERSSLIIDPPVPPRGRE